MFFWARGGPAVHAVHKPNSMPRCFMAKKLKYPYQRWKETQAEDAEVPTGDLDLPDAGEAGHGTFRNLLTFQTLLTVLALFSYFTFYYSTYIIW